MFILYECKTRENLSCIFIVLYFVLVSDYLLVVYLIFYIIFFMGCGRCKVNICVLCLIFKR